MEQRVDLFQFHYIFWLAAFLSHRQNVYVVFKLNPFISTSAVIDVCLIDRDSHFHLKNTLGAETKVSLVVFEKLFYYINLCMTSGTQSCSFLAKIILESVSMEEYN